mmetsp:Transcript_22877/g.74516  ORF Transcript_22877/g.74516 Transcript_22877/m.74516 type:complete len:239 (+) Transcript_22877:1910-2626(+)
MLPAERSCPCHELVDENPELPPVNRGVVSRRVDHLWREILLRPDERVGQTLRLRNHHSWTIPLVLPLLPSALFCHPNHVWLACRAIAQVEIRKEDVTRALNEDVLRLEITVNRPEQVQVLQRQKHFRAVKPRVRLYESPLGLQRQQLVQLPARAVLEDEMDRGVRFERCVSVRHKRVVRLMQNQALRAHAVHLVPLYHLLLEKHFHRKQGARGLELDEMHAPNVASPELLDGGEVVEA